LRDEALALALRFWPWLHHCLLCAYQAWGRVSRSLRKVWRSLEWVDLSVTQPTNVRGL